MIYVVEIPPQGDARPGSPSTKTTCLIAVDRPDALYDRPGGWRGRWALRQQLIAVEALADDL